MRIINMMLSKKLGGIEEAFYNYSKAFTRHEIINIIGSGAAIKSRFDENDDLIEIFSFGRWDPLARNLVKKIFRSVVPDAIIAHGNRAIEFAHQAKEKINFTLIGIAHNHDQKFIKLCDRIITLTDTMHKTLQIAFPDKKIVLIPNMIKISEPYKPYQKPEVPVMGMLGRMVHKKGFDIFIEAIKILKNKKLNFKAIIGGDGELKKDILKSIQDIRDHVEYVGWVNDLKTFYEKIDVLCVPSRIEPFGIVLLDSFHHSKIVLSSDIDGPGEIIQDGYNGIKFNTESPEKLAERIEYILDMSDEAVSNITRNAYETLTQKYNLDNLEITLEKKLFPNIKVHDRENM